MFVHVAWPAIGSHTWRLACMHGRASTIRIGLIVMLFMSSHGAGGPGHPAPPACGRSRLARSAHSTCSLLECRPVCHRRCPPPWPRRCPGQHSLAARRELRPPLPRRRSAAAAGCRAQQCRREPPWVWNVTKTFATRPEADERESRGLECCVSRCRVLSWPGGRPLFIGGQWDGIKAGAAQLQNKHLLRGVSLWIIGGWFICFRCVVIEWPLSCR